MLLGRFQEHIVGKQLKFGRCVHISYYRTNVLISMDAYRCPFALLQLMTCGQGLGAVPDITPVSSSKRTLGVMARKGLAPG